MKALVNRKYKLEKFSGKGGWTFAKIPEITQDKSKPFGWVKVKGTIDGYPIGQCNLMPMGKGRLFLPVKAEIRKKIGKQEGDYITVVLYRDNEPLKIPEELLLCLTDEPSALKFFHSLSESEQNFYIKWIFSAKKEETKINRIAETINRLSRGLRMYDNG